MIRDRLNGRFANRSEQLFVILSLGTTVGMAARLLLPPLLPAIIADLNITPFLAGVGITISWGLYAVFHYPGGRLSDSLSTRTVLIGSLTISLLGAVLLLGSVTYVQFLIAVALIGVGTGMYLPATYSWITDTFPDQLGARFGIVSASINLGGALAPAIVILILLYFTWRATFVPIVLVLLLVLVLTHRYDTDPYQLSRVDLNLVATATRLVKDRHTFWVLVSVSLVAFAWHGFSSFLPIFLQTEKEFSPAIANGSFAGLYVIGILLNPFIGRFGDRFGYETVIIAAIILGLVGLGGVLLFSGLALVLLAIVVAAVGLTGIWPVLNAYLIEMFPKSTYGGDFGLARTIFLGLGSLGPTFVGFVASGATYTIAFWGLIVTLVVGLAIWPLALND